MKMFKKWSRNTTLIVGDLILYDIKDRRLRKEEFQKGTERSKLKTSPELQSMIRPIVSSHC